MAYETSAPTPGSEEKAPTTPVGVADHAITSGSRARAKKPFVCQKCGARAEPAMKHAIFCKACSDALVEAANQPADVSADDLFAKIARNNRGTW